MCYLSCVGVQTITRKVTFYLVTRKIRVSTVYVCTARIAMCISRIPEFSAPAYFPRMEKYLTENQKEKGSTREIFPLFPSGDPAPPCEKGSNEVFICCVICWCPLPGSIEKQNHPMSFRSKLLQDTFAAWKNEFINDNSARLWNAGRTVSLLSSAWSIASEARANWLHTPVPCSPRGTVTVVPSMYYLPANRHPVRYAGAL